ncbi:MAG: hypothetical protein IJX81_05385 [Clostridia bacterium]|nr:hypothetical protein [Clostridia bacterium]
MEEKEQINVEENTYRYTYKTASLSEKREAESILRQYDEREETAVQKMRRLDAKVHNASICWGLIFGVVGTLTFGGGLALFLEGGREWFWLGALLGGIGAILAACAYPVFRLVKRKMKEKYGEEIVRLCEKILQEKE